MSDNKITKVESFTLNGQPMYRVYFRVFEEWMGDEMIRDTACFTTNPDNPNEIMEMVNTWLEVEGNEVENV